MYSDFINFQPLLLGAPLPLGALSARLVRLWVNPALLASLLHTSLTLISPHRPRRRTAFNRHFSEHVVSRGDWNLQEWKMTDWKMTDWKLTE